VTWYGDLYFQQSIRCYSKAEKEAWYEFDNAEGRD
jgi:hypothetical protein